MSDAWRDNPDWPPVDVVMPILNEADHLEAAIASVRSQSYPRPLNIIIAVGPSTDGTEDVAAELAANDDDLVVVPNPSGKTPSALNAAIRTGSAPVVVRVDGHSELSAGYIRRAVELLRSSGAGNVGGLQRPIPTTPFETSVAYATTSILGTGGASYRTGTAQAEVDTVYLGVFDRAAIESVGLFDESLIRNQDYELNIRLRNAGCAVLFDPTLSVGYVPRSSWRALARQYYQYGWWKSVVMRRHPRSIRARQLVAPLGVGVVCATAMVGLRWRPAFAIPAAYATALLVATRDAPQPARTAGVLATIHTTWTAGLVRGLLARDPVRRSVAAPGEPGEPRHSS